MMIQFLNLTPEQQQSSRAGILHSIATKGERIFSRVATRSVATNDCEGVQ